MPSSNALVPRELDQAGRIAQAAATALGESRIRFLIRMKALRVSCELQSSKGGEGLLLPQRVMEMERSTMASPGLLRRNTFDASALQRGDYSEVQRSGFSRSSSIRVSTIRAGCWIPFPFSSSEMIFSLGILFR